MTNLRNKISNYRNDVKRRGLSCATISRMRNIPFFAWVYNALTPSTVRVLDFQMIIDKNDTVVSESLRSSGIWEPYETEVFSQVIRNGNRVLDIGANIGYYSILAGKIVGDAGKVYAFEPDLHNVALLQENIRLNELSNVQVVSAAVSDQDGTVVLFRNRKNRGDHRIYAPEKIDERVQVQSIALDNYFAYDDQLDVIKIDIQGAEMKAMKGMARVLESCSPLVLIIELWPYGLRRAGSSASELLSMLQKFGFAISVIDEEAKTIRTMSVAMILEEYPERFEASTNLLCIKKSL